MELLYLCQGNIFLKKLIMVNSIVNDKNKERWREGDGERKKEREPSMLHTLYFIRTVFLSKRPKC